MENYKDALQFAAQLGVGGLLAAFIFYVYNRRETKRDQDDKGREELFVQIITNNTAAITKNTAVIEANMALTQELRRDLALALQQRERR